MGLNHGTTAPIYGPETGLRRLGPHGCFPSTAPQALQSAWPSAGSMVADAYHSNHDQFKQDIQNWLVVLTPLKNISQWEGLSHILWKKQVPNHQPENIEKKSFTSNPLSIPPTAWTALWQPAKCQIKSARWSARFSGGIFRASRSTSTTFGWGSSTKHSCNEGRNRLKALVIASGNQTWPAFSSWDFNPCLICLAINTGISRYSQSWRHLALPLSGVRIPLSQYSNCSNTPNEVWNQLGIENQQFEQHWTTVDW